MNLVLVLVFVTNCYLTFCVCGKIKQYLEIEQNVFDTICDVSSLISKLTTFPNSMSLKKNHDLLTANKIILSNLCGASETLFNEKLEEPLRPPPTATTNVFHIQQANINSNCPSSRETVSQMETEQRILSDMSNIGAANLADLLEINVGEDILKWNGVITPQNAPYSNGVFRFDLTFPVDYPLEAPQVIFKTKIYHPNIDESGEIKLPITTNGRKETEAYQVVKSVIALVNNPDPENPLRLDLAEMLKNNREQFFRTAEEHTRANSEKKSNE